MTIPAEQYTALSDRRIAMDGLMWNAPGLSLTAQAFLFTVALAPETSPPARMMAGTLALAASLASMQLMAKHRLLEVRDSRLLEAFEQEAPDTHQTLHAPSIDLQKRWYHMSSYKVWLAMLGVFAAASVVVIVSTLAGGTWFSG